MCSARDCLTPEPVKRRMPMRPGWYSGTCSIIRISAAGRRKLIGSTSAAATGKGGDPGWLGSWIDWLLDVVQGFFKGFAAISEVLLWAAVGMALAWIVGWAVANRRVMVDPSNQSGRERRPAVRLFDLDVSPESLPVDIAGAAGDLLDRRDLRGALSLLYRGMLSRFVHDKHLRIADSDTEGECLELVSRVRPAGENEYFAELTREWIGRRSWPC